MVTRLYLHIYQLETCTGFVCRFVFQYPAIISFGRVGWHFFSTLFVCKGTSKKSFWDLGSFASMTGLNQSLFTNPWSASGDLNAPFDRRFYLVLDVAVGSTNGWFKYVAFPAFSLSLPISFITVCTARGWLNTDLISLWTETKLVGNHGLT